MPKVEISSTCFCRAETPLGGLPILEIDGKTLGQSTAIAHLVAKRAGLCGKNDVEAAQAEMVAITVAEMINSKISLIITCCRFLVFPTNIGSVKKKKKNFLRQIWREKKMDCFVPEFASSAFEKDEALKAKKMEEYEKEYLPDTVRKLEALLKKNGGEWFAGSEVGAMK